MYYLLQGGKTSLPTDRNQQFFQKVAYLPSPILFIYYARYESEWETKFAEDSKKIKDLNSNVHCLLADKEVDTFLKQFDQAQTIFIAGGSTAVLKEKLEKIPELPALLKNKSIVGTSAGACVLSSYYVNDKQEICRGMSILPLKIFCHFDSTKLVALNQLKEYEPKEPILLLRETDFAEVSF